MGTERFHKEWKNGFRNTIHIRSYHQQKISKNFSLILKQEGEIRTTILLPIQSHLRYVYMISNWGSAGDSVRR